MSLSKKHFSPNKEDRVLRAHFVPMYGTKVNPKKEEFDRVERLLDALTVDYVNGRTKSDIWLKVQNKKYDDLAEGGMSEQTFNSYWSAIQSRLAFDRSRDSEVTKDFLYSAFISLYNEAVESGNLFAAKGILESVMKLTGVAEQKQMTVSTAPTGNVEIKFGFE